VTATFFLVLKQQHNASYNLSLRPLSKQTFDKMLASQQELWSSKFVQNVSRQYTDN